MGLLFKDMNYMQETYCKQIQGLVMFENSKLNASIFSIIMLKSQSEVSNLAIRLALHNNFKSKMKLNSRKITLLISSGLIEQASKRRVHRTNRLLR